MLESRSMDNGVVLYSNITIGKEVCVGSGSLVSSGTKMQDASSLDDHSLTNYSSVLASGTHCGHPTDVISLPVSRAEAPIAEATLQPSKVTMLAKPLVTASPGVSTSLLLLLMQVILFL